jgi:uncharacterized protein YbjT (DUF2867 family)
MNKARIIVTGATGKTGGVMVTELLEARYPVRALVHREDGRESSKVQPGPPVNKIRIHRMIYITLCW